MALLVVVVVTALVFDVTNGFHDASNSVATSIATRTLSSRTALAMAAALNLLGALLSQQVARTIGFGIVRAPAGAAGLGLLLAALLAAITWNLLTWWWALPSSSTHALIGALAGAGLAASTTVHWDVLATHVVLPLLASPLIGLAGAFVLMVAVRAVFAHAAPGRANRRFRIAQTVSAAGVALGHGLQDAQKSMGVVLVALISAGELPRGSRVPLWVTLSCALALAGGTLLGGRRIIRTVGERLIDLDPVRAFSAEAVTAGILAVGALAFDAPVSTTHTVTAAVAGAGASYRRSAVRWRVARRVAAAWVVTVPACAALAALGYTVLSLVGLTRG